MGIGWVLFFVRASPFAPMKPTLVATKTCCASKFGCLNFFHIRQLGLQSTSCTNIEQTQHLKPNPCTKRHPWSNTSQRICKTDSESLTQHYYRNSPTSIFHFTDFPTSRLVKYSSPQKPLQGEVFADT